jgi:peptide chain release factor 2
VQQERSRHQKALEAIDTLNTCADDVDTILELAEEGEDLSADFSQSLKEFEEIVTNQETMMLLSGEDDHRNAILTIHPGAGGTESQDWAEMLFRMYSRFCERRGYGKSLVDYQPGDEAGLKSATLSITGDYAFGYLKAESGVHRLVRISPFDSNKRRHTSFASVFVVPEVDDNIEIEIDEKDLRIDTYRSSGAGGQHVNVTDSAIRITHGPTGIVVTCQNERSQHKNKAMAMKILKARLYEEERRKQQEKLDAIEGSKKEIAWGSQIRSYVLHPYRMIKDHRTNHETGNIDPVLDGDIDAYIEAELFRRAKKD